MLEMTTRFPCDGFGKIVELAFFFLFFVLGLDVVTVTYLAFHKSYSL